MKDNFSSVAENYREFRPGYPEELFDFIYAKLAAYESAWDVGTGNGQVASVLSKQFSHVLATDISLQQLAHAVKADNITYKQQSAEEPLSPYQQFDLIIVAQAIHWFRFEDFYRNVQKYLKPDGLFAAIGYGLLHINPTADDIIRSFYSGTLRNYWDPERKYIDDCYRSIPFPFVECPVPSLDMTYEKDLDWLCGYLSTWSAVEHYKKNGNADPIPGLRHALSASLPEKENFRVSFPILLRAGKLQ